MKSERSESKSGIRVLVFSLVTGIVLLFSLGIVDRHEASSQRQYADVIAPAKSSEASPVTAWAEESQEETNYHLAGHSELELQCD
jgi:hypothetical protein